ncbi:MAG: (deoxy)nucleoside triphosphate pyrophosphohydrolase [Acetobacteraceae bacterium]|nr:MAG: (deoxy)nucleoside triphosphate pyrophosphohydrolase [Acetobacteraceae bacterium]
MQTFLSRGGPMPVQLFRGGREELSGDAGPMAQATEPVDGLPIMLVAAVALVDTDGRVLLARRPEGKPLAGLWEFPGGKVKAGETPEVALIRELKEELDIDVSASCLAPFTFASHTYEKFHLMMPLYICRKWGGTLRAVEAQTLAWVRPKQFGGYAMPPADKPLVAMLQDFL